MAADSVPLFSVVIPACQRLDALAECLDRLVAGRQSLVAAGYEVIVTDDSPGEPVESALKDRFPFVRWTRGPRRGPAANRNHGATLARGVWIAFTDDDCLPDPAWLDSFARAAADASEAAALEGAIYAIGDASRDLSECPVNETGGNFWSANIAIRAELFRALRGFDENYPGAAFEDIDLRLRVEQRTKIIFVSGARVGHPVRQVTLARRLSLASLRRTAAGYAYHLRKNFRALGHRSVFAAVLGGYGFQLRVLVRDLRLGLWRNALGDVNMIALGLPLIVFSLLRRAWLGETSNGTGTYSRRFEWLSSVSGGVERIARLRERMSAFYAREETRAGYQQMLDTQEDLVALPPDSVRETMPRYVCTLRPDALLEVGCGDGRLYRQLRSLGFAGRYTGAELAEYVIEGNRGRHPEAAWQTAGAFGLPFSDGTFDVCFSLYVLEHLAEPVRGLREMLRVVRPGGQLVLVFPDFIAMGRLPSQLLGWSRSRAAEKIRRLRLFDAILSLWDSRVRLARGLRMARERVGEFPVNEAPICLGLAQGEPIAADEDAIYIASKEEVRAWAEKSGHRVTFPQGVAGEYHEQAFLAIEKAAAP